jgi:hypothetical protein
MIRTLAALPILLLYLPALASASGQVLPCGEARFELNAENRGHILDNVYRLTARASEHGKEKLVYLSDVGGWFFAACVADGKGAPRLLFQEFCGGSACVEDKYGIVDPRSLAILLRPPANNVGNGAQAARVLGRKLPAIPRD